MVIASCSSAFADVAINSTNFPDENFRSYVSTNFDTDSNSELSTAEISAVKTISVSSKNIASLQGIEHFSDLTWLICDNNQLKNLDVSANTQLILLNCENNQLSDINLENTTALRYLTCKNNQLTKLDVSNSTALEYLACSSQDITLNKLDVVSGDNTYTHAISFSALSLNSSLYAENVSNFAAFDADSASITVSNDTNYIYFTSQPATLTYNYDTTLSSMDVTVALTLSGITKVMLNVSEKFPDENFRAYVNSNFDTDGDGYLDDSEIAAVTSINVSNGSITSLQGIEYFTALISLDCASNSLTALDVSNNTALTSLYCQKNQLSALDVIKNTKLQDLRCFDNEQISELDLGQNLLLKHLDCGGNILTTLDLTNNTDLEFLCFANNKFTTMCDLSNNTKLKELLFEWNQISTADLSDLTALETLRCYKNQLAALDLSSNTALSTVQCYSQDVTFDYLGQRADGTYALRFSDLPFDSSEYTSRISSVQAFDTNSTLLTVSNDSNYVYFSALPSTMSYNYNTSAPDSTAMDVTFTFTGVYWREDTPANGDEDSDNDGPAPSEEAEDTTSNSWRYRFTMPSELSSKITSKFGVSSSQIFQFSDSEILSDTSTRLLLDNDYVTLNNLKQEIMLSTPTFRPNNSGVYVMRYSINSAYAGKPLKFHGVTSESSSSTNNQSESESVSTADLENLDYTFYDENYNEITEVPANGIVYAAVNMTANKTGGGVITAEVAILSGTIEPVAVEEQPTLIEKIAETLSIDQQEIHFLTEAQIGEQAPDPTQELKDEVSRSNANLVAKLNTVSVDQDGYYVFKVTLSDDLYEQVKNTSIEHLKIYYIQYEDGEEIPASSVSGASFKPAFITGLLNTFELLTMSGEKMKFGMKEFLMVGFLNAGKPLSLYIAKLILMALLGGCNAGLGIGTTVLLIKFLRRRRK